MIEVVFAHAANFLGSLLYFLNGPVGILMVGVIVTMAIVDWFNSLRG